MNRVKKSKRMTEPVCCDEEAMVCGPCEEEADKEE